MPLLCARVAQVIPAIVVFLGFLADIQNTSADSIDNRLVWSVRDTRLTSEAFKKYLPVDVSVLADAHGFCVLEKKSKWTDWDLKRIRFAPGVLLISRSESLEFDLGTQVPPSESLARAYIDAEHLRWEGFFERRMPASGSRDRRKGMIFPQAIKPAWVDALRDKAPLQWRDPADAKQTPGVSLLTATHPEFIRSTAARNAATPLVVFGVDDRIHDQKFFSESAWLYASLWRACHELPIAQDDARWLLFPVKDSSPSLESLSVLLTSRRCKVERLGAPAMISGSSLTPEQLYRAFWERTPSHEVPQEFSVSPKFWREGAKALSEQKARNLTHLWWERLSEQVSVLEQTDLYELSLGLEFSPEDATPALKVAALKSRQGFEAVKAAAKLSRMDANEAFEFFMRLAQGGYPELNSAWRPWILNEALTLLVEKSEPEKLSEALASLFEQSNDPEFLLALGKHSGLGELWVKALGEGSIADLRVKIARRLIASPAASSQRAELISWLEPELRKQLETRSKRGLAAITLSGGCEVSSARDACCGPGAVPWTLLNRCGESIEVGPHCGAGKFQWSCN